jgi:hypothetical protein
MFERLLLVAALVFLASGGAHAAEAVRGAVATKSLPQKLVLAGTSYKVDLAAPPVPARSPAEQHALMKAIVDWLAHEFGLPANHDYPTIQLTSAARITTFRFTGRLSDRPEDRAAVPPGQREVVAAYDGGAQTIYLPAGWTGRTAAELSVLVHETVHHLQHLAGTRFECAQASETLAYAAQEKWLALFGRSLESEFDIDPFTRLVSTRCMQ